MINKIKTLARHYKDKLHGKVPAGKARSNHWPTIRKHHLVLHPTCEICGGDVKLEVHHVKPFHLNPELELDGSNLITLCEANKDGVNCHLLFGHLGSFRSFNENVRDDSVTWHSKITGRPKGDKNAL